jgi:hypothetical protein
MPPAKSFISTSTIAFCDAEPHSGFAAGQLLGFSAERVSNAADVFFFAHSFALAHKQAWKKYSWRLELALASRGEVVFTRGA